MKWRFLPAIFLAQSVWAALPPGYEVLYLSRNASPVVEETTGILADLLERSYGDRPDIRRAPLFTWGRGLHIGPAPEYPGFDHDPLTDDVVVERTRRGLEIRGSDNTATCFALYRFMEAFLGWRYYMPGPLGIERLDDPPPPPAITGVSEVLLIEQSGYVSRNLSGRKQGSGLNWDLWNRQRERFVYNHALHRVLPPSLFETHPDWFAKDADGKPMRPPYPQPHGYNDHPDLANPDVRNWVIAQSISALAATTHALPAKPTFTPVRLSPGVISTSLSLGDSFVFGDFPADYPLAPESYFRRWPDWGNHVMDYTNALAAAISAYWDQATWPHGLKPRLYMGALSYLNWENAPDFQVHPAVVPYLTYDRSQWYDPAARKDDLALVEQWATRGPEVIGTWDYLFGYGFLIPRSMASIVADSIPALHKRGVRAYFSQVAAIWPFDAHTTWLTARLLWNPAADSHALLDEFFHEFYGPAAPAMRAFFQQAESVWMDQPGSGWWLRYWKDPWQAALWSTQQLTALQGHLESAQRLAGRYKSPDGDSLAASRFAERVAQTRALFGVTQTFAEYLSLSWGLQATAWEAAGMEQLEDGAALAGRALAAREALGTQTRQVISENPNAGFASDLQWIYLYDSLAATLVAMAARAEELGKTPDPARETIHQALADMTRLKGHKGRPAIGQAKPVLHDRTFRKGEDPRIWHHQFMDSEGMAKGLLAEGSGFFAENVRRGHIFQLFPASEGHYYHGWVDLESRQSPSGEIYIRLDFFDKDFKPLGESDRFRMAPTAAYGSRQRIRALMQAPPGAAYGRLFIRFYEMDPGSRAELFSAQVLDLGQVPTP